MTFKVLSYNIRDGGQGRLDLIADVIRSQQPQAVALLEANSKPNVKTLADTLGMHFAYGLAKTHYALIAPHMYCGPVAAAAAIQLDTCSPNFLIQEYNGNDLHSQLFSEPITFEKGYITPPTGPGLGVELDEAVVKRHQK